MNSQSKHPVNIEECARTLHEVALFSDLDHERTCSIAKLCEVIEQPRGEFVSVEGAAAHHLYILLKGEVAISRKLKLPQLEQVEAEDKILTRLDASSTPVLGEIALLGRSSRMASVRCMSDCTLYRLDASEMAKLIDADQVIGAAVYRQLAEMLHQRLDQTSADVVKLSAALVFALEG